MIAGVDGCKSGWVAAISDPTFQQVSFAVAPSVEKLFECYPDLQLLTIDIPIGLPSRGLRACDVEARSLLGKHRASSVFPAPIRPMLGAESYTEALRIGREIDGRGLTLQCWHIMPKICEVDVYLRAHPCKQDRLREVHPEVSFWALAGRPMTYSKRKLLGRNERIELLRPLFGEVVIDALGECRDMGAKPDDVIDALIALWSAKRVYNRVAMVLPALRETDCEGLAMEIVA